MASKIIEKLMPEASNSEIERRVLIGGVGYRWQRDASIGLIVCDQLMHSDGLPSGIDVMDLGYGAIYAAQDIAAAEPPYDRLVLVAGTERGRPPGRIYQRRWDSVLPDEGEIQARMYEAGAGVIHLDHLLVIGDHFGALPEDVVIIEVEPIDAEGGEGLSSEGEALLPRVLERVRQAARASSLADERMPT